MLQCGIPGPAVRSAGPVHSGMESFRPGCSLFPHGTLCAMRTSGRSSSLQVRFHRHHRPAQRGQVHSPERYPGGASRHHHAQAPDDAQPDHGDPYDRAGPVHLPGYAGNPPGRQPTQPVHGVRARRPSVPLISCCSWWKRPASTGTTGRSSRPWRNCPCR